MGHRLPGNGRAAVSVAKGVLGLPARHRLSDYVADIFVHVDELSMST